MVGKTLTSTHRLFIVFAVVAGSFLFFPHLAHAHAVLKVSVPAANSSVPPGKVSVQLTYNSRVDARRSSLSIVGPDGKINKLTIEPGSAPDVLASDITLGSPGRYVLRWQALSSDGHITRGEIPFRIR